MNNKICNSCKHYQLENGKYTCRNDKSEKFNTSPATFESCDFFSKQNAHSMDDLRYYQSLPLDLKIQMTRQRIRGWIDEFGEDGVYVSFSGGKDSTVLLDIVRKDYPNIEAVFVNTGLEYPSVRQFALSKENVTELRPTMNFRDVIIKYGYPIISKEASEAIDEVRRTLRNHNWNGEKTVRMKQLDGEGKYPNYDKSAYKYLLQAPFNISNQCCNIMKKKPTYSCKKKQIIATMAEESRLRKSNWIINGCNAFEIKHPKSNPMSFWTEQDVLTYIHTYNLTIADAYGQVVRDWDKDGLTPGQIDYFDKLYDATLGKCELPNRHYKTTGCKRTGCVFCLFGIRQDLDRLARLSEQEPKLCDYVMRGGEFNENGMWQPSKDGLGYWFVLEWLNVHGNLKIGIPNREHYLSAYQTEETRKYLEMEGN